MVNEVIPGTPVSHTFDARYIILSYLVSVVGCWTTLEILKQQTAPQGGFNWAILVCSAVTMNAVGIWSMHFVGNAALVMGNGAEQERIVYNLKWTFGSLLLPVFVVGTALWILQRAKHVGVGTILLAGVVCGAAICGMHYFGEIAIANYTNEFKWPYILGSSILACVVASLALGMFVVLRSRQSKIWWKRGIVALLLAASISSTHWVAIAGTSYSTKAMDSSAKLSTPLAGWICGVLAIACCILLLLFIIAWHRIHQSNLQKTKHISLALFFLDPEGNILVNNSGYLPCRKIIKPYEEQSIIDTFEVDHELFIWFFRLSRNWSLAMPTITRLRTRTNEAIQQEKRLDSPRLIAQDATENLRRLKELLVIASFEIQPPLPLSSEGIGVLYDRIVETGTLEDDKGSIGCSQRYRALLSRTRRGRVSGDVESTKSAVIRGGQGQLLILVRRADWEAKRQIESQGYSFLPPSSSTKDSIARSLQIGISELLPVLDDLQVYPMVPEMLQPGVYMACLATRPGFSISKWEILVQRRARNLLPSLKLDLRTLETWQEEILQTSSRKTAETLRVEWLNDIKALACVNDAKVQFLRILLNAMNELGDRIGKEIFEDLVFAPGPFRGPVLQECDETERVSAAYVIAFHGFVDIHLHYPEDAADEFMPSNLVLAYQKIYPHCVQHAQPGRATAKRTKPPRRPGLSRGSSLENYIPSFVRKGQSAPAMSATEERPELEYAGGTPTDMQLGTRSQDSGTAVNASKSARISEEMVIPLSHQFLSGSRWRVGTHDEQILADSNVVESTMVARLFEETLNTRRRYPGSPLEDIEIVRG